MNGRSINALATQTRPPDGASGCHQARHARLACWAALLIGLASAEQARASSAVSVSVDATASGTPLEQVWPYYGYDEINYTTTAEGEALLRSIVAAHRAPVHVRSHFLLNSGDGTAALKWGSTNVYTEDAHGIPSYDWTWTDAILDTLTESGALPFVELGFMPEALSKHPAPYRNSSSSLLDGGCFYPPTDYAKWGSLIRAWATHANERYANVATDWLWELWNEPDIGYWHGTFAEYAKLYDYTESALHGVIQNAALGGPAVAIPGGRFLRQFLEHCATGTNAVSGKTGTRLDLVSFHAKGGVSLAEGHVQMNLGNQLKLHRAGFGAVGAFSQFVRTPVYITEADPDGCAACPASENPSNAYRNSPAYGAYELAMMKRTIDLAALEGVKLGGVLTWAFTFPDTPYFGGYRALATNGIHLPVFGAFELLGRLAGNRLPLTSSGALPLSEIYMNGVRGPADLDGLATLDRTTVRVLLWNYHDDLIPAEPTPVRLTVTVPAHFGSDVRVSHLRVDETHGNAYTAWVSRGMPAEPTVAEVAALRQAMAPARLPPDRRLAVAADHAVRLDFDLPRFGVSLVTLEPAASKSGSELPRESGLSGASIGGAGCACDVAFRGHRAGSALTLLWVAALTVVTRGRTKTRCARS